MAEETGRAADRRRMAGGIALTMLLAAPAWAGRPDYSHLSDAGLERAVFVISGGLAAMGLLGLYAWWRYRQSYRPAPGRFTPRQALLAVVAVIALVTALGLRQLGLI